MKHIGLLAHSADGAALCFLEIVRMSARILGAHEHPEMTMSILPMGPTLPAYERGDLAAVNALKKIKKLAKDVPREKLLKISERWKPYRTVATMLLWHHYLSSPFRAKP